MFENNEVLERYSPFFKKYWLPVILACAGLIFFIYGLISLLGTTQKSSDIKFETNSKALETENQIAVDIEGEVVSPGVYELKQSSIVQDALIASGGLTGQADREWVSKNLNLALKLSDGQKIYIPKQGETASNSILGLSSSEGSADLININSASESELDKLPGIGPVTAGKIISQRPYSTIDDLLTKKAVSQKVFDQIKDKIIAQ
ncbi:MAG: hypothetical protein COU25_03315 [Candidatus Levybacteria bacterium CG10_big_fil_rev_8_21_14_0_10_35_13]|nr:MAG: hypothetical protein COU25_03315 [Candidatus Levybacteria bacterium CG10_big_fil_rev_8_21_14_0_10_35_13]